MKSKSWVDRIELSFFRDVGQYTVHREMKQTSILGVIYLQIHPSSELWTPRRPAV